MKYLKRFNESEDNFLDNLMDFCKDYLSYLIDEGFVIKKYIENDEYIILRIYKIKKYADRNRSYDTTYNFTWNSVKDSFIPFFKVLDDNYTLQLKPHNGIRSEYLSRLEENKVIFNRVSYTKVFGNTANILGDIFSKSFKKADLDSIEICVLKK